MTSGAALRFTVQLGLFVTILTLTTLAGMQLALAGPIPMPLSTPLTAGDLQDQARARCREVVGALLDTSELLAADREERFADQAAALAVDYAALLEEPAAVRDWYLLSHVDTVAYVSASSEADAERQAFIAALPIRLEMLVAALEAQQVHAGIRDAAGYALACARWQTVLEED
jgi:hypothetical protein